MNTMTKIECFIVGWKPKILENCKEASYATLKKYVAAIAILSIIWGVIGWCFADNYLAIQSWYGKIITSVFFIAVIVCVERYIILSHGKLTGVKIFRTFLAVLMAVLGSTMFDQIVFKNDIDVKMKEIRSDQINIEVPKRTIELDKQIEEVTANIDSIKKVNSALYDELMRTPVIKAPEITTEIRQVGIDSTGKAIYHYDRKVEEKNVTNPKVEQVEQNNKELIRYLQQKEILKERKLNIRTEVQDEYDNASTGFLEEIGALYSLLSNNGFVLAFYIFLFLFLMCLELLVITTKGSNKCDYELLIDFQLETKKKELNI